MPEYSLRFEAADMTAAEKVATAVRTAKLAERWEVIFAGPPDAPNPDGFWLCYHSDWSGIAVFSKEVEALRHAVEHQMHCEFHAWGAVR